MISEQELSDRRVIEACLQGDKEKFRILVERYKERAYNLALMFTKNRDDALDLSQEAFCKAYQALNRFDVRRPFYGWFYRILRNLCLNHLNQRQYFAEMDEYWCTRLTAGQCDVKTLLCA